MIKVGIIRSCYKEKFGIPRQAGLVTEAISELHFLPDFQSPEAIKELENFSHLWILFLFHGVSQAKWSTTVRPPKLGGNRNVGVFASRSPFRPNNIGLSAVELIKIVKDKDKHYLLLKGGDFLDGTPVIDIKPYLATADSIPHASMGYAKEAWEQLKFPVLFSSQAEAMINILPQEQYPNIRKLITQVLENDPRPGYKKEDGEQLGILLFDLNIIFHFEQNKIIVVDIQKKAF